jgi:nucleotide-binding universal stress UspA family protein
MLVALDGSRRSESMLGAAADLAGALGMTMRLVQVAGLWSDELPADAPPSGYLSRMSRGVPGIDPATADFEVLHAKHPGNELVEYAARQDEVGMLALATRALSARQRLLHHSTTFDLAHHAAVPVLALHEL